MTSQHSSDRAEPSQTPVGSDSNDRQRAASVRVALAVLAAVLLPLYVPETPEYRWVTLGYLASSIGFQLAIRHDFGGVWRVLLGGVVDIAIVTFIVHRAGSQANTFVAAYLLIGMFNAMVAPAWVARTLAALGVLAFSSVSLAEVFGLLAYAPDHPGTPVPSLELAVRGSVTLAILCVVSTRVSDMMARALRDREQQLRAVNLRLEELSQRDHLTQLYNRRYFVQRATEELGRVRRGHPMLLLMMDLDGFKHVNDQQGHLAGDELLRKIARVIEEAVRGVDVVGRFGGDEFVAMLPDTEAEQGLIVAERLVRAIGAAGAEADPRRPVTVSIGLAVARAEDDVTLLLNAADDGAYRAKQAGGGRVHAISPSRDDVRHSDSGPRAARLG